MKVLSVLFLTVLLINCKSEQKSDQNIMAIIRTNVETYFKQKFPDLKGYEFVSIADLDTVTAKDYLDREIEIMTLALSNKDERLQKMELAEAEANKTLSSHPNDQVALETLKDIEHSRESFRHKQHLMDSLTAAMKPELNQTIKYIAVNYSYNTTDEVGAKTLNTYYVRLDKELNVLNAAVVVPKRG